MTVLRILVVVVLILVAAVLAVAAYGARRWEAGTRELRGQLDAARIPITPLRVVGEGILHAAVLGAVPVVNIRGTREVAEGELMRFLAEAAWYPTALLPSQGVRWEAVVLGVPLLTTGLLLERRGSVHGRLLWLGALGYGVYTGPTRFWPSSGRARTRRSPRRTAEPSDARGSCPDHRRRQPARRPGSDAAGRGRA